MITGTGMTWMANSGSKSFQQKIEEVSESIEGKGLAKKAREACRNMGIRFRDPVLQLLSTTEYSFSADVGDLRWASYSDILSGRPELFSTTNSPLKPGILTGGYLFNALSLLCLRPHLVRRLIDCHTTDNHGVYGAWIMKDGRWTEQVVDDWLPMVSMTDSEMAVGCIIGHENEIWPAIVEKAYARAWSGIDQVQLGDTVATLRDITGAAYTIFKDLTDVDVIAERLEVALSHRWLLAVATDTDTGMDIGLLKDELYGVVDVNRIKVSGQATEKMLIQIMDHRKTATWKGAWSKNTHEWTLQSTSKCVNIEGCFWVELNDFAKLFSSLAVFMVQPSWLNIALEINQQQLNKSICLLEVKTETEISIAIDQIDPRNQSCHYNYSYSYIRITVARLGDDQIQFIDSKLSAQKSIFLSDNLVPGRYVVLLQTYWPESTLDRRFTLSVSSAEPVTLQQAAPTTVLFERLEYCLWTNFARNNQDTFDDRSTGIPGIVW